MGISYRMFDFVNDYPALEGILIAVFRKHKMHISLSIKSNLHDPDTESVVENNRSEDFMYLLSHPKDIGWILPTWSRYRPVGLIKMEVNGRKLVCISTSPEASDMMDILSEALVELGGLEGDY
jgi:hypothetical protein